MFCPNCGKQLDDTVKFCDGCGSKVADETATTQTANASGSKPLVAFNVAGINFSIVKEKIDFIGLIAALVAFIALFLPYFTISVPLLGISESYTFYHNSNNGSFILVVLLLYIFFNVFGFKTIKNIVGYVYCVFMVIAALSFVSEIKNNYRNFKNLIDYNAGFWLLVITAIIIAGVPLVKKFILKK